MTIFSRILDSPKKKEKKNASCCNISKVVRLFHFHPLMSLYVARRPCRMLLSILRDPGAACRSQRKLTQQNSSQGKSSTWTKRAPGNWVPPKDFQTFSLMLTYDWTETTTINLFYFARLANRVAIKNKRNESPLRGRPASGHEIFQAVINERFHSFFQSLCSSSPLKPSL